MAKLSILAGATSQSVNLFIQDSTSTTGAGLTGLAYNTAGLTAYFTFAGASAAVLQITLATLASNVSAWSSGGFLELSSAHMPGWYRFDIPNLVISAGEGRSVAIHFQGAANMAPLPLEIELTGWDNQDGVRGGMTALPNAAANAAGGLPISTAGALDMDDIGADVDAIQTSTAGLTFTVSGKVDANVLDWNGTAVASPATAGIPEVNVKNINNVSTSPVTTVKAVQGLTTADTIATYTGNTPQTGDGFARMGAPAGASVSADVAAVKSDTGTILTDVNTGAGAIYARLGAPAGASMSADIAAVEVNALAAKNSTAGLTFTGAGKVDASVRDWVGDTIPARSVTGVPKVDVQDVNGSAINNLISGRIDANAQVVGTAAISSGSFSAGAVDTSAFAQSAVDKVWQNESCTEPTAAVAKGPTAIAALSWLVTWSRNLLTQTATTMTLKADDNATTITTRTVSDDGTTFTRGKAS